MSNYQDRLVDGQFFDVVTDVYVDLIGEPLFALLFFGATGAAFYVVQRRMISPLVTLILIGGVALTSIPAVAARTVIILVLIGLAVIIYLLYQRALGSSRFRS